VTQKDRAEPPWVLRFGQRFSVKHLPGGRANGEDLSLDFPDEFFGFVEVFCA